MLFHKDMITQQSCRHEFFYTIIDVEVSSSFPGGASQEHTTHKIYPRNRRPHNLSLPFCYHKKKCPIRRIHLSLAQAHRHKYGSYTYGKISQGVIFLIDNSFLRQFIIRIGEFFHQKYVCKQFSILHIHSWCLSCNPLVSQSYGRKYFQYSIDDNVCNINQGWGFNQVYQSRESRRLGVR